MARAARRKTWNTHLASDRTSCKRATERKRRQKRQHGRSRQPDVDVKRLFRESPRLNSAIARLAVRMRESVFRKKRFAIDCTGYQRVD
jgi:hypothetical protein